MFKKIIILSCIMLFSSVVKASDIRFYEVKNYKELLSQLNQAAENDFPVFLYIHADWCYVCGYMERDIWSQKRVVSALNKNFLNLSVDITRMNKEKDEMLNYLNVDSTPAYFFYNKSGVLKHRQGGYMIADELLEQSDNLK